MVSVLGDESFGESQKSLRWESENLGDCQGRKTGHVDGFLLLEALEQVSIKMQHAARRNPRSVVWNRLSPVIPVVVVVLVADEAGQGLSNLTCR